MRDIIQDFFGSDVAAMESALAELDRQIPAHAEPRFDERYDTLSRIMATASAACVKLEAQIGFDLELLQATRQQFFETLTPWFDRSWIGERARHKPRGYPGDYKLLTVLYDHRPISKGLPGYIDLFLLELTLTCSIRSRWQKIREFLRGEVASRKGDVSILNVASGSCREYHEPLEVKTDRQILLQCLDNDQEALDYVRDHVVAGSGIDEFRLDRFNVLRLVSSRGAIRRYGKFDIVYSIGLFDYIPDEPLIAILKSCRELLNPGGVAYINFKDIEKYDKTPYQWWMDWHFFARTVDDCKQLFSHAGYDMGGLTTSRDDTGVIVNFVSRAPSKTFRIDFGGDNAGAHTYPPQPWQQDSKEA